MPPFHVLNAAGYELAEMKSRGEYTQVSKPEEMSDQKSVRQQSNVLMCWVLSVSILHAIQMVPLFERTLFTHAHKRH